MAPMEEISFNASLATALEKLASKKVTNRKELEAWKAAAEKIERSIGEEHEGGVPQFVWHYLGDADIRMRNARYRADQERRLESVLAELGQRGHRSGGR
jgi:hypothetical protein